MILWEDGPQACMALAYWCRSRNSSPFIMIMNLALPVMRVAFAQIFHGSPRDWSLIQEWLVDQMVQGWPFLARVGLVIEEVAPCRSTSRPSRRLRRSRTSSRRLPSRSGSATRCPRPRATVTPAGARGSSATSGSTPDGGEGDASADPRGVETLAEALAVGPHDVMIWCNASLSHYLPVHWHLWQTHMDHCTARRNFMGATRAREWAPASSFRWALRPSACTRCCALASTWRKVLSFLQNSRLLTSA